MKIYIAGPMSGLPYYNFSAFDQAQLHLESLGHEVVNPADIDRSLGHDPYLSDNRTWCPEGGTVLDPFCGSGTTGAVTIRHGRKFIGIDDRESQVELTERRLREAL